MTGLVAPPCPHPVAPVTIAKSLCRGTAANALMNTTEPLRDPAMRILVAWDDPSEAELLKLYLNNGDNEAVFCATREEVLAQVEHGPWDSVLMTLTFPKTADESFALFGKLQDELSGVPVLAACRQ